MSDFLGMCGCDCGSCPSYKGNLRTAADRERVSAGWEQYLGIRLRPEKLIACDGCSVPREQRKAAYLNCRVRQCAIHNGAQNCAYCSAWPCEDVRSVHSLQQPDARAAIEERIGSPIPEPDYLAFIEPYEGIRHLDRLRATLDPAEIVQMRPISVGARIAPFPAELPLTAARQKPYRRIHQLISSLEVHKGISCARKLLLVKRRRQLLKLLWAAARYGEWDGSGLRLSGRTWLDQGITAMRAQLEQLCESLADHGVKCELIPSATETDWLTPTGGLRRRNWQLRVSSTRALGGTATLRALVRFAARLAERFGDKAYARFARADMSVLA
jgi:hypothetical protein